MSQCIPIHPSECLRGVLKREHHTRKEGCYLLEDRHRQYLIVAQKLPVLVSFLNSIAPDASTRVSITALYQIADKSNNRVGGFSKYRWRLRFIPFGDVSRLFQSERGQFEHAMIVGQPDCYAISRASR